MCFRYYFRRIFAKKEDLILVPLTKKPQILCQLCNLPDEVSTLECSHHLCKGCIATQKLYTYDPCFVCKGIRWPKN